MENIVDKAERKGREKSIAGEVSSHIKIVLKASCGACPLPSDSYIEKMVAMYGSEVFNDRRFNSVHLKTYRNVLSGISEGRRQLPNFDRGVLREFGVALDKYYNHPKGGGV